VFIHYIIVNCSRRCTKSSDILSLVLVLILLVLVLLSCNLHQPLLQSARRRLDRLKLLLIVRVNQRAAVRLAKLTVVVLLGVQLVSVLGLLRLLLGRLLLLLLDRGGRLLHRGGLLLLAIRLEVNTAQTPTLDGTERTRLALCSHRGTLGRLHRGRSHLGRTLLGLGLLLLVGGHGRQVGRKVGAHQVVEVQTLTLGNTTEHRLDLTTQNLVKHLTEGGSHLFDSSLLVDFGFHFSFLDGDITRILLLCVYCLVPTEAAGWSSESTFFALQDPRG